MTSRPDWRKRFEIALLAGVPRFAALRASRTLGGRIQREVVWCAGDLTALFVPTAPHWRALETQAHVEYASSLIGVYWRRQQWLRRVVDEVGAVLDSEADQGYVFLKVGSLDDASWVQPEMHIYTAARQPWIKMADGLPEFEGAP